MCFIVTEAKHVTKRNVQDIKCDENRRFYRFVYPAITY